MTAKHARTPRRKPRKIGAAAAVQKRVFTRAICNRIGNYGHIATLTDMKDDPLTSLPATPYQLGYET